MNVVPCAKHSDFVVYNYMGFLSTNLHDAVERWSVGVKDKLTHSQTDPVTYYLCDLRNMALCLPTSPHLQSGDDNIYTLALLENRQSAETTRWVSWAPPLSSVWPQARFSSSVPQFPLLLNGQNKINHFIKLLQRLNELVKVVNCILPGSKC